MMSPLSRNLFLRGIAESGVAPAQWALQRTPLYWAKKLGTNIGCPTSSTKLLVGCLRDKPVDDVVNGVKMLEPLDHGGKLYIPWTGVIDGYFIAEDPVNTLAVSKDKDFLLGHNSMDAHMFASLDFLNINVPTARLSHDDIRKAATMFAPHVPEHVADSVAYKYIDWEEPEVDNLWPKLAIVNLYTDTMFVAPTYFTANERVAAVGTGKTYLYRFSEKSRVKLGGIYPNWMESDHTRELFYTFGHPFEAKRYNDSDRTLSLAMMTYWTNFAWSGDPNYPNQEDTIAEWPEYRLDTRYAIELNTSTATDQENYNTVISNYRGEYIQFWTELMREIWTLPLETCPASTNTIQTRVNISPVKFPYENRAVSCPDQPLVRQTTLGCVEGYEYEWNGMTVERYLGIPYAKPPTGTLRFTNPQSASPWEEVRDAKNFSKICPQGSTFDEESMSEDCLYMCVYVPRSNSTEEGVSRNLAVMVWIHGGAYQFGNGMAEREGDKLAALGDVIIVTFNYRLGSFGFMTTDDAASPGNYGLFDQRMALKWVKDNIAYFGGNSDKITIFGESAGGQSVHLHTLSPANDDLEFAQAIMESPTIVAHDDLKQLDSAIKLATEATCDVTSGNEAMVECLKGLDTRSLLEAQSRSGVDFLVTVDGTFLPDHPKNLIDEDRVKKWTYLMGVNSGEGSVRWGEVQNAKDEASFHQIIDNRFREPYGWRTSLVDQQYADYDDLEFFEDEQKMQIHLTHMFGDERYVAPTSKMADDYTDIGSDVFFYYFTYPHQRPDFYGFPAWAGAAHSAELSFVFGEVLDDKTQSDDVKSLSRTMIQYWSNFAKTGNPNSVDGSGSLVEWPSYKKKTSIPPAPEKRYLQLDLGNKTEEGSNLRPTEYALWNDLLVREAGFCEDTSIPSTTVEPPTTDPNSPVVETENGPVRGKRDQNEMFNVDVFLGIPYALPPVGNLRFSKTVPIQEWNGLLEATDPKPPCLQSDVNGDVIGDEDCLYLDVFVPAGIINKNSTDMPVMIWIHGDSDGQNPDVLGGSFWSGGGSPGWKSGSFVTINPSYLSSFGNVVIIRPNFRIGALGFMTLENDVMTGNYGMWDLTEVLQWTTRNAQHFGGNPNKITLFGQGSGAAAAELLAVLPTTKNYVKRVISQSGSSSAAWLYCSEGQHCRDTAHSITSATGCENTDEELAMVECLRAVDSNDIVEAVPFISMEDDANSDNPYNAWGTWRIHKDGVLIPNLNTDELFADSSVDFITGTASHEFFRYLETVYPQSSSRSSMSSQLEKAIEDTARFLPGSNIEFWPPEAYSALTHSYTNWDNLQDVEMEKESAVKYYTDLMFAVESSNSVSMKSKSGQGSSYQYVITRPLTSGSDDTMPTWLGGRHGDDVTYVFGIPFTEESKFSNEDREFCTIFMSFWINFAWNGDPNNALADKTWRAYKADDTNYLDLNSDRELVAKTTDFNTEKNHLWGEVVPGYLLPDQLSTTMLPSKATTTASAEEECPTVVPPIAQGLGLNLTPEEADTAIYAMFSVCLILGVLLLFIIVFWLLKKRALDSHNAKYGGEKAENVYTNQVFEKKDSNGVTGL